MGWTARFPGDLIETCAWRGGVTIMMRVILKAYGDTSRKVWVADAFEGLPNFNRALNPGPWAPGMMAVSLSPRKSPFREAYRPPLDTLSGHLPAACPDVIDANGLDAKTVSRMIATGYEYRIAVRN